MAFLPFSPSSPTLPPNGEGSLLSLRERERVRENWQGTIARPCAVILILQRKVACCAEDGGLSLTLLTSEADVILPKDIGTM